MHIMAFYNAIYFEIIIWLKSDLLLEKNFINLAGNCTKDNMYLSNFFADISQPYLIIYRTKITKSQHMVRRNFTVTDFDITCKK